MGEITGRKVLAMMIAFFGVIIAVNFTLAWQAVSTFPGLEVDNSYVASQTWDAQRAAQKRLGWTLASEYDHEAGVLELDFADAQGLTVPVSGLKVLVGRPTEAKDDVWPAFTQSGSRFTTPLELGKGKWMLKVEATAPDGTLFRQRLDLYVKG